MSSEIEPVPHFAASEISGETRASHDRLDGEPPGDYALFRGYLNQGSKRSMRALSEQIGIGLDRLHTLSSRNSWVTRANEHDAEITRRALAELEGEGVQMRARHAENAKTVMAKAMDAVEHIDPKFLIPRDIPVWIDVASKLERSSRGVQDAAKRVEITGAGGGPIEVANALSAEDRRALLAGFQDEIAARLKVAEIEDVVDAEVISDDGGESS